MLLNTVIEKSKINLAAAQLLQDKTYFAPSVHCAFYSCLQFLMYLAKETFKITDSEIAAKTIGGGTHKFLIDLTFNELNRAKRSKSDNTLSLRYQFDKTKLTASTITDFNSKIVKLKMHRVDSDYKDKEIRFDDSREAICLSQEIVKDLKQVFFVK